MEEPIAIGQFQSGQWVKQYEYRSFKPELVNRQWLVDDPELAELVTEASRYVGELNAFSQLIPNVDFFIRMHVAKEATTSSRIEGTQTHIEDAFLRADDVDPEKRDDWQEVQNYIEAMNEAIDELERLPVSNRLIRQAHRLLMQGVRGETKQPGEFRNSQNWIGGASLRDAVFIPPHQSEVPELMGDVEKFLHNEDIHVADLIRIAIAHYQFETIHPFLDGNGRTGRLLITLYLVSRGLLVKPTLYLSDFFERNRQLYYDRLMRARTHNELNQWLRFFMVGVAETAQNSIQTFRDILTLKSQIEEQLPAFGKKYRNARLLAQELYQRPIVTVQDVAQILNVSTPTANTFVRDFMRQGILQELTGYKRNRIFVFDQYLSLFESRS
ncbi:MAG: Fic family protein [Bacteroidetes bacterium]|nr:Fic family protein [Fibrella sp.]